MASIVRSELTKIATLPSVWLVTAILVVLHLTVLQLQLRLYADAIDHITPAGTIEIVPGLPEQAAPAVIGDLIASSIQVGLFVCVLGAVTAGSEFRSGQLGMSLLAVPSRVGLLVGRSIAASLCAVAVGLLFVAASTAYMYVAVQHWKPSIIWSAGALAGQTRFLLFIVTSTLTASAITSITRRTLVGVAVIGLLTTLTITQVVAAAAPPVDALLPVSAARNLLLTPGPGEPPLSAGPTFAAAVLIGWAIVTLAVAGVVGQRRDAR